MGFLVPRGRWGDQLQRNTELSGTIEMYVTSGVVVNWMYTYVKTHQTIHLHVYFIYKL